MASKIEELAAQIATLDEAQQRAILDRVAELNYRHGLTTLSEQYRERLRRSNELNRSVDEILAKLKQTREEIAARDYS
ncbi:MAG: hypothetical protein AB1515_03720 [Nitrospirota bacterium]